jgi:hypothetical protein
MVYAFINNSPSPELRSEVFINVAMFIGLTGLFAFCWVKFKMKKGLFQPEAIEQAIKD